MASILDDLKGILSPAEYAKLEASEAVKTRISRGDELRSYYDGEPEPVAPPVRNEPPPVRATPPGQFDLSQVEASLGRMLDAKLGTINTTIETKIAETVTARGAELVNSAVSIAMRQADELNRVYHRHSTEFGESFDSNAFNEFLMKPENSLADKDGKRVGSKFPTVMSAYEAMVAPRATQKQIADGIKAGVAAASGTHVPGTTPAPAVHGNIVKFMKRGGPADGAPATGASKAAAMLDRIQANRNEAAS